jgi:AraC-like DNA-binding protein|tara:strand:- start:1036 stop:2046 length:1011 start_codon:yes stop_codon:yes gene_type:complete
MPEIACISSNYSRVIARVLGLQVRQLPMLISQTEMTIDQFLQEDTLLTSRQQIQILHNALEMTDKELFGLYLGQILTPTTHGAMGFMASSSPNLLVALKAFKTYLPTRIDFLKIKLTRSKCYWECSWLFDAELNEDMHRILSEVLASVILQFAEFIVGDLVKQIRICFSHSVPSYYQRYSEFLPGLIEFAANELVIKIPTDLCKIENASGNHENYSLALRQCQSMLDQLPTKTISHIHQLKKIILTYPVGDISEETAASMLFISKRTLSRKLKQEGSSFRKIRDELLSQQACSYLENSEMSVDAIAAILNYHDSSNFRRAFKRWFQLTPDQFRRQL